MAASGEAKRPPTKQEREISLITEACARSGHQTNGYARHVFERMSEGEREHGVDTYKQKDVFKELLDEAADLAGWSLLEYDTLEELKRMDPGNGNVFYLQEVLKECMRLAAIVHTQLSHAQSAKEDLAKQLS